MRVVDASVAFKWFIPEASTNRAMALIAGDEPLCAPDIIQAEVANAIWVRLRRSPGDHTGIAREVVRALPQMLDDIVPVGDLMLRAVEMAFELGHPVYDCRYLALAERAETRLVTADARLFRVAQGRYARLVEMLG